jgi:hypothetical protein
MAQVPIATGDTLSDVPGMSASSIFILKVSTSSINLAGITTGAPSPGIEFLAANSPLRARRIFARVFRRLKAMHIKCMLWFESHLLSQGYWKPNWFSGL